MNFDKKDEDTGALFHLDKTQVFQDARAFNASPIQPKKCRVILTKIKCTRSPRWGSFCFCRPC
jgi:coatomer protein complex subunit gamma